MRNNQINFNTFMYATIQLVYIQAEYSLHRHLFKYKWLQHMKNYYKNLAQIAQISEFRTKKLITKLC